MTREKKTKNLEKIVKDGGAAPVSPFSFGTFPIRCAQIPVWRIFSVFLLSPKRCNRITKATLVEHIGFPASEETLDVILKRLQIEESFFATTLPFFRALVVEERKTLFPDDGVPLLTGPGRVELSKRQCAFLIGCAFFGIFDAAKTKLQYPPGEQFNIFTFALLWRRHMDAPLTCIFNYMTRFAHGDYLDNGAWEKAL